MKERYDSVELAKIVVDLGTKYEMFMTPLQLQKIMYYIQGNFMTKLGYKAFPDKIECWTYGPVVKDIWSEFSKYGRMSIPNQGTLKKLDCEEEKLVLQILKDKLSLNVWKLVDETHEELPWKNANQKGALYLEDSDMLKEFK